VEPVALEEAVEELLLVVVEVQVEQVADPQKTLAKLEWQQRRMAAVMAELEVPIPVVAVVVPLDGLQRVTGMAETADPESLLSDIKFN
jgi:hypothetical protein